MRGGGETEKGKESQRERERERERERKRERGGEEKREYFEKPRHPVRKSVLFRTWYFEVKLLPLLIRVGYLQ